MRYCISLIYLKMGGFTQLVYAKDIKEIVIIGMTDRSKILSILIRIPLQD